MAVESPFKIRPHRIEAVGKEISIWGETDKLEEFLEGITAALVGPGVSRVLNVDAHTVSRWPGDTGYTRKAHQRVYTGDLGFSGGITPGRNFWIEEEVITVPGLPTEWKSYQFTHTGPFYVLKAFCVANAKQDFRLRSSGGRAHLIETSP